MRKPDVIVVGGGVIGLCVAYFVADQGGSVILLEKDRIPAGSSYGNAGLIVPSHCDPLPAPKMISKGIRQLFDPSGAFSIRYRPEPELLRWLWTFYRFCNERHFFRGVEIYNHLMLESAQHHEAFALRGGSRYEYEQSGLLHLFASRKGFHEAAEAAARMADYGIEFQTLSEEQTREMDPAIGPHVVGAIRYTADARLYPAAFLTWLAQEAVKRGVRILTETDVIGFGQERGKVQKIHTTRGVITGDQVVLAAGAWTPQISKKLGLSLAVQAAKGYSLTFRRPTGAPRIPVILQESYIAMTPYTDRFRISGVLELSGLNSDLSLRRLRAIQHHMHLYFSGLGNMKLLEIWRGFRPCAPDGLPMVGRAPSFTNLWVATGHSTKGMTLGPVTGRIMAGLLSGRSSDSLDGALRVDRF